jgi:hypothetical protein
VDFFRSFGRNWFEYGLEGQTYHLGQKSLSGGERNRLFRNDGGRFVDLGWGSGVASNKDGRGFVPADFDRDGDLDFLLINNNQPWEYMENQHPALGHWLTVQLKGTKSNSHGIGARVSVTTTRGEQIREIRTGAGYLSSPPPEAHFGLGAAARVARLTVAWPSGKTQVLENVAGDQVLVIHEAGGE